MKKCLLVLSIIISIITLFTLILSYFGIIRYISVHFKETKNLAEKYSEKSKSNHFKDDKIVISMFSYDPFKENLKPVINSILDQTIKIDSILIFTNDKINKTIPKYIDYTSQLIPSETDYCYGNNIIPAILKEKSSNVIIIPIKNKIYGEDYIETLLEYSNENPDSCIFGGKNDLLLFNINNLSEDIHNHSNDTYSKEWFLKNMPNKVFLEYLDIKDTLFK